MNRILTLILAFIGIGILVCTLFVLTRLSVNRVVDYIKGFGTNGIKRVRFGDITFFLFRLALSVLLIYDWWIFFVEIYDLFKNGIDL